MQHGSFVMQMSMMIASDNLLHPDVSHICTPMLLKAARANDLTTNVQTSNFLQAQQDLCICPCYGMHLVLTHIECRDLASCSINNSRQADVIMPQASWNKHMHCPEPTLRNILKHSHKQP